MRVLIDTNIVLDALLEREAFVQDARTLFTAIQSQQIQGFVTAKFHCQTAHCYENLSD